MFTILAFECSPSVRIGICQFKYDLASILRLINAPAKRADVTCSPEDKRTSSSLLSKLSQIFLDKFNNSFVLPDIADTTTIS